jgi:hypothetical protein
MGILAEGLAYTHSLTHDTAINDWLSRYAAAVKARGPSADMRLLPALAYVGRNQGRSEYTRHVTAALARLKFGNWGKPFTITGRIGFALLSTVPAPAQTPTSP